ncbi:amphi-Trp domain-containing protein [Streptacidiphilus sp. ASG 303]|uniref:amphi-Trp domain-containing protein n=1 Tax=Streptacidiphilus sp. ASG 303 TaxID=2896847 RepID=UPI001E44198E|nr:amphi-Trp domain-containing protein [Streptacidiphilus sp. ASG 303]MCD0484314.1 amphi-Trp domain-containing protein [Streptacidiphilus sp. ASG 303]
MKDLKFTQKRPVSRLEAAERLMALANALKGEGEIEWDTGHGRLTLRVPGELQSEVEIEVGEGKVELEIELEWSTTDPRPAPRKAVGGREEKAVRRKGSPRDPASGRAGPGTPGSTSAKRPAEPS